MSTLVLRHERHASTASRSMLSPPHRHFTVQPPSGTPQKAAAFRGTHNFFSTPPLKSGPDQASTSGICAVLVDESVAVSAARHRSLVLACCRITQVGGWIEIFARLWRHAAEISPTADGEPAEGMHSAKSHQYLVMAPSLEYLEISEAHLL